MTTTRSTSLSIATALTIALVAADVRAAPQRCPTMPGGSTRLAALDAQARLEFIRGRLRYEARKSRQWHLGFGITFAAATVSAAVWAPIVKDDGTRVDIIVGGAGALIGVAFLGIAPLSVMRDQAMLEDHLARLGPHVALCRQLAAAESLLDRDARNEADGRGWLAHTLNAAIGVAALLVLGLGFKRWRSGIINAVSTVAVGELMIGIQPHGLMRDLKRYRAGELRPPPPRRRRGRR